MESSSPLAPSSSQAARLALKWSPYIPQAPTPRQTAFLLLADGFPEAFYGGAAGGGKSSALLMSALQYADVPGYAALILRRTYRDLALPGALMDRAQEWLGPTDAVWQAADHSWRFPSGATLTFGYLDGDNDVYRYQGAEFQYVGFDEATQFSERQYRYLFSRLRRLSGSPVPIRMRAASNPGGPGHDWVKQRFLIEGPQHGRVFITARLADNPHLDRDQYEQSLDQLDPVTRAQLLSGDWEVRERGALFRREWFPIVERAPAQLDQQVRYWDLAATVPRPGTDPDWTAGALVGADGRGTFYVLDVRRTRGTPQQVEALVAQTATLDGNDTIVMIEQEPGGSGISLISHYQRNVLPGYAVRADKVTSNKVSRAMPLASMAEAGNVKLVRGPWITAFLDEAEAFPYGTHAYDDAVDAVAGGFQQVARPIPRLRVLV